MKKIIICLLFCFAMMNLPVQAENFDLNYYLKLAQDHNINVNEAMKSAYIGTSFDKVKSSKRPYIVVFANFEDLATASRYVNNAYTVYNNLHEEYGFTVYNVKNSENKELLTKFKVTNTPSVYITNPKSNSILPIKSSLYDNPQRLVTLLKAYLPKTR